MKPRQRDRVRSLLTDASEPLDAQSVADGLGLHVTTARFHLNNLVSEGAAVQVQLPPEGVGRPRVGYRITATPPIDDLLVLLIGRIGDTAAAQESLAAEVGHSWAARHLTAEPPATTDPTPDPLGVPNPVVTAETILTRLGFAITGVMSAFGDHEIELCGCPLQTLADDLPEVARGVVRGIIEEALEASMDTLGSAYTVTVSPDRVAGACELRLRLSKVPATSHR